MSTNAERARARGAHQSPRNDTSNMTQMAPAVNVIVLTPAQLQTMLDEAASRAVNNAAPKSDVVDTAGLCREYGISAPTARKWIGAGMPCLQCGEVRRFNLRVVEQWLSERGKAGAT